MCGGPRVHSFMIGTWMTVSTTLLASRAVLGFGIMWMGAVAVVEMGFSFMSFRCIKLSTVHSFDVFPQWWRVGVTFCASWSFASVRFLQGGENVCKVLKAKKNQRRKKKVKTVRAHCRSFSWELDFFIDFIEVVSTFLKIFRLFLFYFILLFLYESYLT